MHRTKEILTDKTRIDTQIIFEFDQSNLIQHYGIAI